MTNPFPQGLQPPQPLNATTALGTSVASDNPHLLNAYSVRWDFDVQHQFGSNLIVELGYEGNHGVHLGENQNLNYTPINYLSTAPTRNQAVINRLNRVLTNPFKGLFPNSTAGLNTASKTTVGQLILPYPEYTGVTEDIVNDEGSRYEMGFIQVKKRLSHGLQFQGSYTHSRLMSDFRLNPETPLAIRAFRTGLRQSRRSECELSACLSEKARLSAPMPAEFWIGIIGGWVVNSISTYQSGAPLAWGNVIYLGGPLDLNPSNPQHTFNTAASIEIPPTRLPITCAHSRNTSAICAQTVTKTKISPRSRTSELRNGFPYNSGSSSSTYSIIRFSPRPI